MSLLSRLAAGHVTFYAAVGAGGEAAVDALLLQPGLQRAASPRGAGLLLVAGKLREADAAALRRVHDQLPHPRATLWWDAQPLASVSGPHQHEDLADVAGAAAHLRALQQELWRDPARSEGDWQADEPPAPWQGLGANGQGGEGMMGGKPYGRPMAMTADDLRDGLALDAYDLQLGPFMPQLPPGLTLSLTLQGDVVQQAQVTQAPYARRPPMPPAATALRGIARLLALLELPAQAQRCRAAALQADAGDANCRAPWVRQLRHTGALLALPPALGRCANGSHGAQQGVRERLLAWIDTAAGAGRSAAQGPGQGQSQSQSQEPVVLGPLLQGLEWQEALLVAASFEPSRLHLPQGPA